MTDHSGRTTIQLDIDLSQVRTLRPGETFGVPADTETEVYVVRREDGRTTVDALSIRADLLRIIAENSA